MDLPIEKIEVSKYIRNRNGVLQISDGVKIINKVLSSLRNGSKVLLVLLDASKKDSPVVNGKNFKLVSNLLNRYLTQDTIRKNIQLMNTEKNLFLYRYIHNANI